MLIVIQLLLLEVFDDGYHPYFRVTVQIMVTLSSRAEKAMLSGKISEVNLTHALWLQMKFLD